MKKAKQGEGWNFDLLEWKVDIPDWDFGIID